MHHLMANARRAIESGTFSEFSARILGGGSPYG
jgi:hypothetical protein